MEYQTHTNIKAEDLKFKKKSDLCHSLIKTHNDRILVEITKHRRSKIQCFEKKT